MLLRHILEHVGADDEIERASQLEGAERAEAALTDVAAPAEGLDGVRTRFDAGVLNPRAHFAEREEPPCLTASNVERRPHAPAQHVLRRREREMHLSFEHALRRHARSRIAIPAVEVCGVVRLGHSGAGDTGRRARGAAISTRAPALATRNTRGPRPAPLVPHVASPRPRASLM